MRRRSRQLRRQALAVMGYFQARTPSWLEGPCEHRNQYIRNTYFQLSWGAEIGASGRAVRWFPSLQLASN
jgi:hypothetical protein